VADSLIDVPGAGRSDVISALYDADLGINRALMERHPTGLAIVIPSTDAWPGDQIDVWLSSKPILSFKVPKDHDGNSPFDRFIDTKQVPEGVSELFYRLNGAESAHLKILVRTVLPGGIDPKPELPGHYRLFAPQVHTTDLDGTQDIFATILPWAGMRAGHVVHLQFANLCLPHTVTESEAGLPVVFTLTQDMIAKLGSRTVLLFYKLWDELGTPASDHSLARRLTLRLPSMIMGTGSGRQAPRIIGVNQDDAIDVSQLGRNDIKVEIDVAANGLTAGNSVRLNWWGEPPIDPPKLTTWTQTVGASATLVFSVASAEAKSLVGGWASITWALVEEKGFLPFSPATECFFIDTSLVVVNNADNSVLAINPPYVPESKMPVEGSDVMCGIPLSIYDGKPEGLLVTLDPYVSIAALDFVQLMLNGETRAVDTHRVAAGTENDQIHMHVPPQLLIDGINTLEFIIRRVSGNKDKSRQPLTALYHRIRPGIKDLDSAKGHSELKLAFPPALNNGVDVVKEGLDGNLQQLTAQCTYPYCRVYDHIDIDFDGYVIHFSVPPSQAPQVPSDLQTRVTIVIPAIKLDRITSRRGVAVKFMVTDRMDNTTDPKDPWSPETIIDVDRKNERLPEPIFLDHPADTVPEIIDLKKLAGQPLSLVVRTIHPSYRAGDEVKATFRSPPSPDYQLPVGIVEAEFGQTKPLILHVPNNLLVADRTVSAFYDVQFKTVSQQGYSRTAFAQVTGLGDLRLPDLLEAIGTGAQQTLAPLNAVNGATVRIVVTGLRSTDTIKLTLTGSPGAGTPNIAAVPGETDGSVDIPIPARVIAANCGNGVNASFTLSYVVTRGVETFPSGTVTVTVTPLPASSLIPPVFVVNGVEVLEVLDLNQFTGNGLLHGKEWSFMESGQQVFLNLEGLNANGQRHYTNIWNGGGSVVNDQWVRDKKWPAAVTAAYLQGLAHNTKLSLHFWASLNRNNKVGTAIAFPLRVYTVKTASVVPTIASVKAGTTEVPHDGTTDQTSLAISGTGSTGHTLDIYDGEALLDSVTVKPTGIWDLPARLFDRARHVITARTSDGKRSLQRVFTVLSAEQAPTITSVQAGSVVIPPGGDTIQTRITVTGTVTSGRPVELYNNETRLGTGTVTGVNWTIGPLTFGLGTHVLTARTLDGSKRSAERRFTVKVETQTPNITSVMAGGRLVPNNGATYYQSDTIIKGTASPGHRINIYDGGTLLGPVTTTNDGLWTLPARGFSLGGHSITARTTDGSNKISLAYTFTVQQGLSTDITNFNNRHFNGWATGPAIQPRDLTFHFNHGSYVLNNYTYTNWSSGVLLYKTFYNLQPNVTYYFTIRIARFYPQFTAPLIRLRTDQSAGQAWTIATAVMNNLTIAFSSTTPQLTLYIDSLEASGNGNDWDMAWIQVHKP
jgi:hypothetical protein